MPSVFVSHIVVSANSLQDCTENAVLVTESSGWVDVKMARTIFQSPYRAAAFCGVVVPSPFTTDHHLTLLQAPIITSFKDRAMHSMHACKKRSEALIKREGSETVHLRLSWPALCILLVVTRQTLDAWPCNTLTR